ncbi:MAG: ArsA family ATPase [Acidobacteria bacterium]|nr:ArsA family ATPase [Acidobacteriota bacterium]
MTQASARLPLTIFCGKGGVGKTTLSLAYALAHANAGRNALVVSSHPLAELAVSVSLAGLQKKAPLAASRLFVIHIDPKEILEHTVRHQIPSGALADAVVSSRIYQSLIEVAPGLKEMVFLGRLQQLAEQRSSDDTANKYDVVVWDAPATGHFLQTMEVSRHFNLYLSGPFSLLGKEIMRFFSDASNFTLLPVTTLEEMAVEETIELCGKLGGKLGMLPRAVVCNMASPLLSAANDPKKNIASYQASDNASNSSLQFILDRLAVERSLFEHLRSQVEAKPFIVERRHRFGTDLDLLLDLSGCLAGVAES